MSQQDRKQADSSSPRPGSSMHACIHSFTHSSIHLSTQPPRDCHAQSSFLGALDEPHIKSHSHPSLQCCWGGLCINHQNSKGAEGGSSRLWDRRERTVASGRGGLEHSPEEVALKPELRGKRWTRASWEGLRNPFMTKVCQGEDLASR